MATTKTLFRGLGASLATVLMLLGTSAQADVFTFSNEFSGSGDSCANVSCATLEVTQVGSDVKFELSANLASGEFITGLFGNTDVFALLSASNFSVPTGFASLSQSQDAFKADGDGFFDWVWDFPTSGDTFTGTEKLEWTFLNVTIGTIINAISVNGPEGKNGFTFALRVQGLGQGNEGSGWFYAVNQDVPEPGTLALLGIGLAGLGLARRRRKA